MAFTPNKLYSVQSAGSAPGTWGAGGPGTDLNTGVMGIMDNNMGGIVTLSLSASPVPLDATQSQMAVVRMTGALLAPIAVTTACVGFTFVENLTTGAFAVTFTNGVAGVTIPQGSRATVITDPTNGARVASSAEGFVSGFKMLAFQTAAPTSWTKDTTLDQATIRLVSGAVGADGGSSNFLSVFTARTISQANIPNYNLGVSDPGHSHSVAAARQSGSNLTGGGSNANTPNATITSSTSTTGITVNSGGSGTAIDFAVKYADAIRIIRN